MMRTDPKLNAGDRVPNNRTGRALRVGLTMGILVLALVVLGTSLALAEAPTFSDVPSTHPYFVAITNLASRGIVDGYGTGAFGPEDDLMRQQFAKMIVLTAGYLVSEQDVCPFTDVQKSGADTLYPDNYVAVCAARGITIGKTAVLFDPYSKITRYQVITMVVRVADDLRPGILTAPPADWTPTGAWGADATHGANAARAEYGALLTGLDLDTLDPTGNMTRGEVAQVLHNLLVWLTLATTTTEPTTTTTQATTTTTSSTNSTSSTTSSTTTTTEWEPPCG